MPLEMPEAGNYIRARVKNPDDFIDGSFRIIELSEEKGIWSVQGKLKNGNGSMVLQAYRFDIRKGWTMKSVKLWIDDHNIKLLNDDKEAFKFTDLRNIEIFSTGVWNDDEFDESDLEEIIKSFYEIGDKVQPFLKLGHDDNQMLVQNDGYPAAGWIKNLRVINNKLVADISDVPPILAELIKNGAYKRVSCEMYPNYEAMSEETLDGTKKVFPWVLTAVALLGADTPAVTNLSDVMALYSNAKKAKKYVFNKNELEDIKMTDEEKKASEAEVLKVEAEKQAAEIAKKEADVKSQQIEVAKKEVEVEKQAVEVEKKELAKKVSEFTKKQEKFEKIEKALESIEDKEKLFEFIINIDKEKKEYERKSAEAETVINKAKSEEVERFVSDQVEKSIIMPAQKEMAKSILLLAKNSGDKLIFKKEIANAIGVKEEIALYDALKQFIQSFPSKKLFETVSRSQKLDFASKDEERRQYERQYMKDNGVEYSDAQLAIKKAFPDLYL